MKAKTKRVVTALLAAVMLLTTLLPLTASAADVTMDLSNCHVSWDYTLTDEDGNKAAQVLAERVHARKTPFHWFRCILKSPHWYGQLIKESKRLDPGITLLSAPEFFELYRMWLKEKQGKQ